MSEESVPLITSGNVATTRSRSRSPSVRTTNAVELSPSTSRRNNSNNNTNSNTNETIEAGNVDPKCEDCLNCFKDALMYGPYAPARDPATKKKKTWFDHWNIVNNSREIFFRERDTNLNCMGKKSL